MGVFELADKDQTIIFVGYAGGKSLFGLKGEVTEALRKFPAATHFRAEVTTSYHTRYRELLMVHVADHGALPSHNESITSDITLGQLSPG